MRAILLFLQALVGGGSETNAGGTWDPWGGEPRPTGSGLWDPFG